MHPFPKLRMQLDFSIWGLALKLVDLDCYWTGRVGVALRSAASTGLMKGSAVQRNRTLHYYCSQHLFVNMMQNWAIVCASSQLLG